MAVQADFLLVFLCWCPDSNCDWCNIVGVFESSHIRHCSCYSFVTQWSGIHPLLEEVVVLEGWNTREVHEALGAQLWTEHLRGA